jgi:5,5'-dehydrodivanillate O-demethylase oxygenase subunit
LLTRERNDLLTQTGRGTPMGELLRRYWMPIGAVSEFDKTPIRAVRLMGEDLVLYKDLGGRFGLVDRHCAHRRADLSYGFVEECGIRCNYHGWLYDETGRCTAQPYEDVANPAAKFKDRVRLKAYPVEAKAGLLWAYLGPEPKPLIPDWEPFSWKNGFVQIVFSEIPCNWFQCQENSIDPVHFEWMHANWSKRLRNEPGAYSPSHLKVDFDEIEWGFVYRRIREDTDEKDPLWTVGRLCLWPNALYVGDHFEWRVPIDDENTLSVTWHFSRVPRDREPYAQNSIPAWWGPIKDPRTGRWITSHVMNQDFVAWVGQGRIADRTQENLGQSDRGIALMRRRFLTDLDTIAKGGDPKALVRDPARNRVIELPIIPRRELTVGLTREEIATHPNFSRLAGEYVFQAGQPEEVRRAYEEATGFKIIVGNEAAVVSTRDAHLIASTLRR